MVDVWVWGFCYCCFGLGRGGVLLLCLGFLGFVGFFCWGLGKKFTHFLKNDTKFCTIIKLPFVIYVHCTINLTQHKHLTVHEF